MDDDAFGRVHDDPHRSGNVVAHAEKLKLKDAQGQLGIVGYLVQVELEIVFLLPSFDDGKRQIRPVERWVAQFRDQVRDAADMVVMRVRDDDAHDVIFLALEIVDVGNDVVDAGHVFFGKLQAHVDDDDIVAVFQYRHVASDFFNAAYRYDAQYFLAFRPWRLRRGTMPIAGGPLLGRLLYASDPLRALCAPRSSRRAPFSRSRCFFFLHMVEIFPFLAGCYVSYVIILMLNFE